MTGEVAKQESSAKIIAYNKLILQLQKNHIRNDVTVINIKHTTTVQSQYKIIPSSGKESPFILLVFLYIKVCIGTHFDLIFFNDFLQIEQYIYMVYVHKHAKQMRMGNLIVLTQVQFSWIFKYGHLIKCYLLMQEKERKTKSCRLSNLLKVPRNRAD